MGTTGTTKEPGRTRTLGRVRLPNYTPTAAWFRDALAMVMRSVARNPSDKLLASTAVTLARVATAAKGFMDTAALEKRITELEETATAMMQAERHGMIAGSYGSAERKRSTRAPGKDLGAESPVH